MAAMTYTTCGGCGIRYADMVAHDCPRGQAAQTPRDGADATGDRLTELARAQGIERIEGESDGLLLRRMGEAIYARHEGGASR